MQATMRTFALLLINFFVITFCQPQQVPGQASAKALPPTPYNCDSENPDPKYFGESCKSDDDCFGNDKSMTCSKGKCACSEGFIPGDRFLGEPSVQKICVGAPYLFQPCETICQKPAVCKASDGQKVCQCDKPYKLVDGACLQDCKDNENYDQTEAKCVTKCKKNEVKIKSSCKPVADIGGKCEDSLQCSAAYARCIDSKCSCLDGFAAKGSICVPKSVTCPAGDPLKKGDDYQTCTFTEKNPGSKKPPPPPVPLASEAKGASGATSFFAPTSDLKDDCPDTHYCLLTGGANVQAKATGYCCPDLKIACPTGQANTNATCEPATGQDYCPWESHFCYGVSVGVQSKQICCPRSCMGSAYLADGKCYSQVQLNEECVVREQCADPLAECANGKCTCPAKAKVIGGSLYKYCTIECKETEVQYNNDCYSYLKHGESCKDQEWRCQSNAYCNKNHFCECQCGTFSLAQDVCAPAPTCPKPIRGYPGPVAAEAAGGPFGKGIAKPPVKITEEKKKELLKNVTFCNVKGKTGPKVDNTVAECPKGQYCANYISNLGICCSIPEPLCFDSTKPSAVKGCDLTNPLSCGPNSSCQQYLSTADPDSTVGHICCKNQPPQSDVVDAAGPSQSDGDGSK